MKQEVKKNFGLKFLYLKNTKECVSYFIVAVMQLHLAKLVGRSVEYISKLRAVFALRLLPNCPQLSCRVPGFVIFNSQ